MPKKIKDESGNEIEVLDQSDVEAAVAAAKKAVQDQFEVEKKQLEQDVNPNWKAAREKIALYESQMKDKDEKLAAAGVKAEQKTLSAEDVVKIAREESGKAYSDRYKEEVLGSFGDKRAVVEKYFDKLSAGETLDRASIESIAKDAARLAGATQQRDNDMAARSAGGGSMPNFPTGNGTSFTETEEGKATAAAMGLPIEAPKK